VSAQEDQQAQQQNRHVVGSLKRCEAMDPKAGLASGIADGQWLV
jgi:hypothetical protein